MMFLFLFSLMNTQAFAWKSCEPLNFACTDGHTLGVVACTLDTTMPPVRHSLYVEAYCDHRNLEGLTKKAFAPIHKPQQIKKCLAEKADWISSCYDKEFVPKCLDKHDRIDIKKCFQKGEIL